jgi:oxygen-dependent protoporphyrinogen oxidase
MSKTIVILGGGVAGLSSAYYLEKVKAGHKVILLDGSDHLGGKVQTIAEKGFVVETGPDSFITIKPSMLDLVKDLGLEKEIIEPETSRFHILKEGKLLDVPEGMSNLAVTDRKTFLKTKLFSYRSKLRIMMEPFIPKKESVIDESLGSFITRRFGPEMLEMYAEPLFCGIYSTPAKELSMMAAFPHFLWMEAQHGSLTKANLESKAQPAQTRSAFVSLKKGIQNFTDKLIDSLKSTEIRLNDAVESISYDNSRLKFIIHTKGDKFEADELISSLPANKMAVLLKGLLPEASLLLDQFSLSSSYIVTLAYPSDAIGHNLDSTGFVVPKGEESNISACTWTSSKWLGRSPTGYSLFRCFLRHPEKISKNAPAEAVALAHASLAKILSIKDEPVLSWTHPWQKALPQYKVGHLERVADLKKEISKIPGLQLTGAYIDGVGMPDCIRRGKEAAENLIMN